MHNLMDKKTGAVDTECQGEAILSAFKGLYQNLNVENCRSGLIEKVYAEDMMFEDSFHRIEGREKFLEYCESLYENISFITFEFHDQWLGQGNAMLTWTMTYGHPLMKRGKPIEVEGATLVHYADKVTLHKDYFDGGKLLYENIPLFGSAINFLKKRLV